MFFRLKAGKLSSWLKWLPIFFGVCQKQDTGVIACYLLFLMNDIVAGAVLSRNNGQAVKCQNDDGWKWFVVRLIRRQRFLAFMSKISMADNSGWNLIVVLNRGIAIKASGGSAASGEKIKRSYESARYIWYWCSANRRIWQRVFVVWCNL